jgi:hypothetical protein
MVRNSNKNNDLIMKGCYNFFNSQIIEELFLATVLISMSPSTLLASFRPAEL